MAAYLSFVSCSQTWDPSVDHVAGSDQVHRVLSSWTDAADKQRCRR